MTLSYVNSLFGNFRHLRKREEEGLGRQRCPTSDLEEYIAPTDGIDGHKLSQAMLPCSKNEYTHIWERPLPIPGDAGPTPVESAMTTPCSTGPMPPGMNPGDF